MSLNTLSDFGYMYSPSAGAIYMPISSSEDYSTKPTGLYNDNGTIIAVYNPNGKGGQVFKGKEAIKNSKMKILPVEELNNQPHKIGDTLKWKGQRYKVIDAGNNKAKLELIQDNTINKENQKLDQQPLNVEKTSNNVENKVTSKVTSKPKLVSKPNNRPTNKSKISGNEYIVKQGDNLSTIAKRAGISLNDLLEMNPEYKKHPNKIFVGNKVKLVSKSNTPKQKSFVDSKIHPSFTPDIEGLNDKQRMMINYQLNT